VYSRRSRPSGGKGAQRRDTVKNLLRDAACGLGFVFGDVLDDVGQIFGCRLGPSDAH
jgi:hypothetical protein